MIPGSGRTPGKGNGCPPQDSCLENSMNRGTWQATVHGFVRFGHNLATNDQTTTRHSVNMNLSKLWEVVEYRGAWVLQSMGSQRIRHDLATQQQQDTH